MKSMRYIFIAYVLFVFPGFELQNFADDEDNNFVAPGAELTKVQGGFEFTEGPTADANGNIYFTDIMGGKILKWTWEDNAVTLYKEHKCQPNGLMFDGKGRLVICEMDNHRVTLDDMKGTMSVLADNWNGKKFNMPNDLWIDAKGGIYFSDFAGGPGSDPNAGLQVYYLQPDLKTVVQVTNDLVGPNGLVGTPNGEILYVTDPSDGQSWSYNINADGTLSGKELFTTETTDGMTIDENGNVYFSGRTGIQIFSPSGEKIGEIQMPENCSNLEFGGKERKTLFITAGSNVYTLEMAVRGAPTALDLSLGKE